MKKLLIVLSLLFLTSCGTPPAPVPPGPPPTPPIPLPPVPIPPVPTPVPPTPPVPPIPPPAVMVFEVKGQKIQISAQMKETAAVSLAEMKAAVRTTVAQLEGVSPPKRF